MGKSKIKIWFDEREDILYISLKKGEAVDSEEREEDVRVEYDNKGRVIGIEVSNVAKRLINPLAKKIISVNNLVSVR